MNLLQIVKLTEKEAREYLEGIRWPDGPICPHCGNCEKIYALQGKATREGLYKCSACRKQFSVTVGTVMHRSHLSCLQWVTAFHLMCSSKKGVSALQLQRELGMASYESAWFLSHRIRAAMEEMNLLHGDVEVDETWVGGKPRKGESHKKSGGGYATKKNPVVALISRDGQSNSQPIPNVWKPTLQGIVKQQVHQDSRIMTDELMGYRGLDKHFQGGHETVCHSKYEYSRGDVHINTAEAYFALLKRGVHGTFHHVSRKHLGRYCHEFSFRWSRRKTNDGQRTRSIIAQSEGKRLTYEQLIEAKN